MKYPSLSKDPLADVARQISLSELFRALRVEPERTVLVVIDKTDQDHPDISISVRDTQEVMALCDNLLRSHPGISNPS